MSWPLNRVELSFADSRGIHVRASSTIQEGDILLRCEPLGKYLMWERRETNCANCFKALPQEKDRTICRCSLSWCSQQCKRNNTDHRTVECEWIVARAKGEEVFNKHQMTVSLLVFDIFQKFQGEIKMVSNVAELLRARPTRSPTILMSQWAKQTIENKPIKTGKINICPLIRSSPIDIFTQHFDPSSEISAFSKSKIEIISRELHRVYRSSDSLDIARDCVSVILRIIQFNSFYICDELFKPVAAALFPFGSMFNHSCVPNAIATYEPGTGVQVFRALRSCDRDEELCVSYVDLVRSPRERAVIFQKEYAFLCDCKLCTEPRYRLIDLTQLEETLRQCGVPNLVDRVRRCKNIKFSCAACPTEDTVDPSAFLASDCDGKFVVESSLPGYDKISPMRINTSLHNRLISICSELDKAGPVDSRPYVLAIRELQPKLHPLNLSLYSMGAELYSRLLDQDDLVSAVRSTWPLLLFLFAQYYSYIPIHPQITLQLFTYADLLMTLDSVSDKNSEPGLVQLMKDMPVSLKSAAKAAYKIVYRSAKVLYGPDHEWTLLALERQPGD